MQVNKKKKAKTNERKKKHRSHPHTSETSNHLTLFNETCHHNVDWFFSVSMLFIPVFTLALFSHQKAHVFAILCWKFSHNSQCYTSEIFIFSCMWNEFGSTSASYKTNSCLQVFVFLALLDVRIFDTATIDNIENVIINHIYLLYGTRELTYTLLY